MLCQASHTTQCWNQAPHNARVSIRLIFSAIHKYMINDIQPIFLDKA